MTIKTVDVGTPTGDEGYLLDPNDWDEDIANVYAAGEDITLTDDHWTVIRFIREWFEEHGVAPSSRDVMLFMKSIGSSRNRLFELFPYGYVQQACKIAGMKKPRSWSTG